MALELKIGALNREHERTVEFIQQREQELVKKLEKINKQNKEEKHLDDHETQTDIFFERENQQQQKCFDEEEQTIMSKEALRREKVRRII